MQERTRIQLITVNVAVSQMENPRFEKPQRYPTIIVQTRHTHWPCLVINNHHLKVR